ncbi:30S ribosomal protein S2, partial [bacterium]|nr:30S ribosomal protein S2 [bacterium]
MIQLKDLVKAGVHFGHRTARWSPSMRSYIWGARGGIHLIDVSKTAFLMEHAAKQLEGFAAEGKSILWVGTKRPARETIAKAGERTNCPVVVNRWVGGALTNFDQIKKAITRLLHLKDVISKPLEHYTKKELCVIQKEVDRLDKKVGGIVNLKFPPAAIVVVDAKKEATAVREASYLGIPVIGLVDTNTDPKGVSVVIPANDDSPRSISLVINYLVDAV